MRRGARRIPRVPEVATAFALTFLGASSLDAQPLTLLTTTDGPALTSQGPIENEEILLLPSSSNGVEQLISSRAWAILLGDADGNGRLDDEPTEIDALAPIPGTTRLSIWDLAFSLDVDRPLRAGRVLRDGDLLRLTETGQIEVLFSEEEIAGALATFDDVDLDGACLLPDGSLIFSLGGNIITLSPGLAADNGSPLIDDHAVLMLTPGAPRAHVLHSGLEMIAMANRALGTSYVSLIDVQGLEIDPHGSGEDLLFATGLRNTPGAGTVLTTRDGGRVAHLYGRPLVPATFGFVDSEDLNALALVPCATPPPSLRLLTPEVSAAGDLDIEIGCGGPGRRGRLLASSLTGTKVTTETIPGLGGAGLLFLDRSDALFRSSLRSPKTWFRADGSGRARVTLAPPGKLAGTSLVLQAFVQETREASYPVLVRVTD
jgi:hypothetical protein